MKIDILAFGAHPDDIELSCGGTLIKEIQNGKSVVLIDLTKGELGTRGTAKTRKQEAANAADILGVSLRENMSFSDGFIVNDKTHQLEINKRTEFYYFCADAPDFKDRCLGRSEVEVLEYMEEKLEKFKAANLSEN